MNANDAMAAQRKLCICPYCPTYHECTGKEKEALFCMTAVSKCIKVENGCQCSECPIHRTMNLRHHFYCTRGTGKKQHAKK
jgi:hypothetical protein